MQGSMQVSCKRFTFVVLCLFVLANSEKCITVVPFSFLVILKGMFDVPLR